MSSLHGLDLTLGTVHVCQVKDEFVCDDYVLLPPWCTLYLSEDKALMALETQEKVLLGYQSQGNLQCGMSLLADESF